MKKLLNHIPYFRERRRLKELNALADARLNELVDKMKQDNTKEFFATTAEFNALLREIEARERALKKLSYFTLR